jgi:deoxyribodipyrimidine photolyase-related protein
MHRERGAAAEPPARYLRPGHATLGGVRTVWVFGDQLNRHLGALAGATPRTHRVLFVESDALLRSRRWHRQRAHVVVASLRRFAAELRDEGFDVDHRQAPSLAAGLRHHVGEHRPDEVLVTEPNSWDARRLVGRLGCTVVPSNQFLCHHAEFAGWASGRKSLRLEDFYRWQRRRLGYLMDNHGDAAEPVTGRWNYDSENRRPPPRPGTVTWPQPVRVPLDDLDREVLDALPDTCWGAEPDGTWPTTRAHALRRLEHVVAEVLPQFGPFEDAITEESWHLAHSLLSSSLNLGLLLPGEVCDAVSDAYWAGRVSIASAEGFVRQVLGWREYVWGVYWLWMPGYRDENALGAVRPLPPVYTGAPTDMRCVAHAVGTLHDHGWVHHIQRLMVLGNLALVAGVTPWALTEWMWAGFVDGAEWVMVPNVVGMSQHADGGRMATKPYAAGGAYIDRMSDHCGRCRFDRTARVGEDACPFTTLYWDFLARHEERFLVNPRVARQVRAAQRLGDLPEVRARARDVLARLDRGEL